MSMDFIKSCSTNVQILEKANNMGYTVYRCRELVNEAKTPLPLALADLRARRIVCAAVNEELWVFGAVALTDEQSNPRHDYGFEEKVQGTLGEGVAKDVTSGRKTTGVFLDALEASLAYVLAREHGLFQFGPWTWISAGNEDGDGDQTLLKLHVTWTEAGTLFLSTLARPSHMTHPADLESLARFPKNVLLAPGGAKADLVHGREQLEGLGSALANEQWKSRAAVALRGEGIFLKAEELWLTLDIASGAHQGARLLWPSKLCFGDEQDSGLGFENAWQSNDWKHFFTTTSDSDAFKNPLAVAEDWFVGAAGRASAMVSADPGETGPSTTTMQSLHNASNMSESDPLLASSPPFNQRLADHQAALSGVYPTPPDGLIPGPNPATQQSLNSETSAGLVQADSSASANELLSNSDDHQLGAHMDQSAIDLFGDMGGLDFGANEVDDADFSFFDDPDEANPAAMLEDVEMDDAMLAPDMTGDQQSVEMPSDTPHVHGDDGTRTAEETPVPTTSEPVAPHLGTEDQTMHDMEVIQSTYHTQPADVSSEAQTEAQEKPLSPFSIRERLLPPPIPASAINSTTPDAAHSTDLRRSRTFDAITFNDNLRLNTKYLSERYADRIGGNSGADALKRGPDISLPQRKKRARLKPTFPADPDSGVTDIDTESEDDSSESDGTRSDDNLPPRLPWDTRKRKRSTGMRGTASFPQEDEGTDEDQDIFAAGKADAILMTLMRDMRGAAAERANGVNRALGKDLQTANETPNTTDGAEEVSTALPPVEQLLELTKLDLVYIAQIVSEQSVSTIPSLVKTLRDRSSACNDQSARASAVESFLNDAVELLLPDIAKCTLTQLAPMREPFRLFTPTPTKTPQASNTNMIPSPATTAFASPTPGNSKMPLPQSRFPQRTDSVQLEPGYFTIAPPYVHVRRGPHRMETLPTALRFWSALGLSPTSGPKDVRAVIVVPANEDLAASARQCVDEIGSAYEGKKLGNFKDAVGFAELEKVGNFEEGCLVVAVETEDDGVTLPAAMRGYANACKQLGLALANAGHVNPEQTIVVYMVNPFGGKRAGQYMCAAFWLLCKAYRDNVPKTHKNQLRSDLVLQVLPVSLFASLDGLTFLDAQQLGTLATELYDRCPPSSKFALTDSAAPLPMLAAPAVELASHPPKRITFQLSAETPSDLLHEGSILHLAYALSGDGEWICCCWTDNTGRYSMVQSLCLRGHSFAEVAEDIWDRTLDIIKSREVTWRVVIVSETLTLEEDIKRCWKRIVSSKPRKQTTHVTLFSVRAEPGIQLAAPAETSSTFAFPGQGQGIFTPATTPQGTISTASPDASGTNTSNAPPTPAPSETAAAIAENDPDAHLVEVADESWGVQLMPSLASSSLVSSPDPQSLSAASCLVSGILFRRGTGAQGKLEGLGASLHWDIAVRQNANGSNVVDAPFRNVEMTLKTVLTLFRHLGVLARAKGLLDENTGAVMPVHVLSARQGAKGLDGLLG